MDQSAVLESPSPMKVASDGSPRRAGVARIALFFLILGLIASGLDWWISAGLRKIDTSKFAALRDVMTGGAKAEIIISGSSRALNHYDPDVIERVTGRTAYNIGMNASQLDLQAVILKTYLNNNPQPKIVVQNLDLFSFEATEKGQIYDPGTFIPYLNDEILYEGLRSIDPVVQKWKYLPLYGYAAEDMQFTWVWGALRHFGINPQEDYRRGFNPRAQKWNNDFDKFKAGNAQGVKYRIDQRCVEALDAMAALCAQHRIQFLLVFSPQFTEVHALEQNRTQIIRQFTEVAKKWEVPFWDYSDSQISRTKDFFFNSQHLNAGGARVFSSDIGLRIKSLNAGAP